MSVKTVETHRAHIKTKLNLESATRLVQFCVRWVEDSDRLSGLTDTPWQVVPVLPAPALSSAPAPAPAPVEQKPVRKKAKGVH